ncbi:MAG: methyl-accepting chemotaxis protein, partial [Pseudomonadota bacterium]
ALPICLNSMSVALEQVNPVNCVKQRHAINFKGSVHGRAIAIRDVVHRQPGSERNTARHDFDRLRDLENQWRARERQSLQAQRLEEANRASERAEQLKEAAQKLPSDLDATVRSSTEAMTAIDSTVADVATTAAQATHTTSAVNTDVNDGSAMAREMAASTRASSDEIVAANRTAMGLRNVFDRTSDSATKAPGKALPLVQQPHGVGSAIEMINSIADQTNLLALNETIEAARTSEAGNGSAVVAGELKSLADHTAKATSEIGGRIESMTLTTDQVAKEIAGISDTMRTVRETVNGSVESLVS